MFRNKRILEVMHSINSLGKHADAAAGLRKITARDLGGGLIANTELNVKIGQRWFKARAWAIGSP